VFIRGSGAGQEYKRVDNAFYRGIVVKNNDPLKLNRVKIYIPELTNQPYEDWWEKFQNFNMKGIGTNCNPKTESERKTNTDWEDTKLFDEVCAKIPWAEPCAPILGETGTFRYYKDGEISTISDCNYPEGFETNNKDTPSVQSGSFSPAFLYENEMTALGDAFSKPLNNFSVKCNPYSFSYRPSKYVNKGKGVYGMPEVGSSVWVFHFEGDLNYPVYFGTYLNLRQTLLMNDNDNENKISSTYPLEFEN